MAIDKAVILAAGLGNRIARASTTPKPFLPLDGAPDGVSFVEWHVARLTEHGVREIYIVGNRATCGRAIRAPEGANVTWVLNPSEDLSLSGSGHSAWFAFTSGHNILDGRSRVALMDADILYEPAVVAALDGGAARASSCTLVCGDYRESDEEVMVFGQGRRAITHGKALLNTRLVEGLTCFGEATGMLLWEPEDHALLMESTRWCMTRSTAKERSEHEDITQRVMLAGRVEVEVFDDLLFSECDTPEEYAWLKAELYPAVTAKLTPR